MILPARPARSRVRTFFCLLAALAGALPGLGAARSAAVIPALAPEEARRAFRVEPGLRVELVAAEPQVVDPVAFAFDERGRLFVVENRGYPGPVKRDQSQADGPVGAEGRIALLEDRDGDGRYERRTEFATGLTFPNGVLPWRGGVFVTCAPDILYLKDEDGDGVADVRRVVLTGFSTSRTSQIRTSHPTLGLDGRVYVTSGLNGGEVTSPLHPERAAVKFATADGRFDPETLAFETLGGRGQYGLTFDAYGRRFICSNRHPVMQVLLDPSHLRRNPHLAFADTVQHVSRVEAEAAVWPLSRASVTADFMPALMSKPHAGTFTAASGVHVYGGTALGPEYAGSVFICESAQNLVQRQVLRPAGATFRAEPAQRGREFLATTDVWFRPVFAGEGPDGALYLADMYRREIDHPAYVPEESRGRLDFASGRDRGRIYRVVREGASRARTVAWPAEPAALARELDAPDAWLRERAQRLLVEKGGGAAGAEIERVARQGARPEGRARALWTLAGRRELRVEILRAAAGDAAAGVREQAVILAGRQLAQQAELGGVLLAAARDDDARVRFVAALELGSWAEARAVAALAGIAARDGADRWTRAAVLSGIGGRLEEFRAAWGRARTGAGAEAAAVGAVTEELARLLGTAAPPGAAAEFLAEAMGAGERAGRLAAVAGLAEGLRARAEFKGQPPGAALTNVAARAGGPGAGALARLFEEAVALARDPAAGREERGRAIALLGQTEFAAGVGQLGPLLDARQPPDLQLQVVRALERAGDSRGAEMLVRPEFWQAGTPQIREAILGALTGKPGPARVLLAAVRRGDIKATEISSVRRGQLQRHANPELRAEAKELFQALEGGDRMAVYQQYRALLAHPADPARGAPLFERACSACHTFRGAGGRVGPDLSGVRNQPADALLLHILVPNYEVAPAYQTVTVTTIEGRATSGWVVAETDSSVTLRTAAGTEETVLRSALASLTAVGVSLMPDGLEQTMSQEELMALLAYLKSEAP